MIKEIVDNVFRQKVIIYTISKTHLAINQIVFINSLMNLLLYMYVILVNQLAR